MTARALTEYLQRVNLTYQQFAQIVGVTEGAASHWVKGRRDIPGYVVRLVEYFEDDIRDFALDEG